ncbi:hypothetical protein LDVICp021 [lymphocystis disease virus-China]|uniref:Uncharacterized protein n=1 Tax=lymphocystis disease virus-China TaxID=256729 RepID=Q678I8_9VIRU|nr:hypothetical protein LDVICp021 [lymphocystis disease virus-China]AAU10869.1 hypothetical protein [lymphocystis disease virus-China]
MYYISNITYTFLVTIYKSIFLLKNQIFCIFNLLILRFIRVNVANVRI